MPWDVVMPCAICLSVRLSIRPSIPPSLPLYSPQHFTDLFIFGSAIGFSMSINPIAHGVHFLWSSGTLKFYEYTDELASWSRLAEGSRPLDSIFLMYQSLGVALLSMVALQI